MHATILHSISFSFSRAAACLEEEACLCHLCRHHRRVILYDDGQTGLFSRSGRKNVLCLNLTFETVDNVIEASSYKIREAGCLLMISFKTA